MFHFKLYLFWKELLFLYKYSKEDKHVAAVLKYMYIGKNKRLLLLLQKSERWNRNGIETSALIITALTNEHII